MFRKNISFQEANQLYSEAACSFYSDSCPRDLLSLTPLLDNLRKRVERVEVMLGAIEREKLLEAGEDAANAVTTDAAEDAANA